MAICILDWRFWTHVSAVSYDISMEKNGSKKTNIQAYLTPESEQNQALIKAEFKKMNLKVVALDENKNEIYLQLNNKNDFNYRFKIKYLNYNRNKFVLDYDYLAKHLYDKELIRTLSTIIFVKEKDKDNKVTFTYRFREIYPKVETGKTYSQVTLPTIQDNFTYGLDQTKFNNFIFNQIDDAKFYNNDCVNATYNALLAANREWRNFSGAINLDGSSSLPTSVVVKYARRLRNEIRLKTLNSKELDPQEKRRQVLEIEVMRLRDSIHNAKGSFFSFFKQSSIKIKEQKLAEIQKVLNNQSTFAELVDSPIIKKGFFRHKTHDHLVELQKELNKLENQTNEQSKLTANKKNS